MGKMKQFGAQLAELIFTEGRDDEYIHHIYMTSDVDPEWLQQQIDYIRANPQEWGPPVFKKKKRKRKWDNGPEKPKLF